MTCQKSFESLKKRFLLRIHNPHTRANYEADFRSIGRYLRWGGGETEERLSEYLRHLLREHGLKLATVRQRAVRLRKFYAYLVEAGFRRHNPVAIDGIPKTRDLRPPASITESEFRRILRSLDTSRSKGAQTPAMIGLMAYEALRVCEVASLRLGSFTRVGRNIEIEVRGKGGTVARIVALPQTVRLLRPHLNRRLRNARFRNESLFVSETSNNAMSTRQIRHAVSALFSSAKVSEGKSCHSLRHFHAAHLHHVGVPIGVIQKRLRHREMQTTLRYLEGIPVTKQMHYSVHKYFPEPKQLRRQ